MILPNPSQIARLAQNDMGAVNLLTTLMYHESGYECIQLIEDKFRLKGFELNILWELLSRQVERVVDVILTGNVDEVREAIVKNDPQLLKHLIIGNN